MSPAGNVHRQAGRGSAEFIQSLGDISQNVIWGGVKVGLIPTAYGIIVYIVSLVLRIIKKPRI
jgi:hypothetical protein